MTFGEFGIAVSETVGGPDFPHVESQKSNGWDLLLAVQLVLMMLFKVTSSRLRQL